MSGSPGEMETAGTQIRDMPLRNISAAGKSGDFFRQALAAAGREDFHRASHFFRQAADMPGGKELWRWKSLGFCPTSFSDADAIDRYFKTLQNGLDLALYENIPMDWRTLPADGFCPSFNLPHLGKCCKDVRETFCRLYDKAFEKSFPKQELKLRKHQGGKLRIGFHALHGHEGGFTRGTGGLIEGLDKNRFDIFVFVPDRGISQCKQNIRSDEVIYVPLGGPFEHVTKKVRDAECDLIYYRKAGSDPWSYFFPYTKCAPVQVTSYGTHGTSGMSSMDYFLSSRFVEPESGQDFYTETLFNVDSMPTFQRRLDAPESPVLRSEFNLPDKGAIYFCPHRTAKYHPSFDGILKQIANRVPASRFVLLIGRDPRGRDLFLKRLQRNLGPELFKRFTFIPALSFEKYKRLLSLATAMLDSPVYAGGLTSFDAFSYGIPEVTLSGPLHVQNFATGIYRAMGMDHLPCRTVEEYVDLAVRLGTEPEYRESVSREIEAHSNKIFGSDEIVTEHERFFETVCS